MRVLLRSAAAGLLILAFAVPSASASPRPVSITLTNDFLTTGVETFAATGFCPSGSAVTSGLRITGGGHAETFHLEKTLTCGDGSGTLTIRVDAATHWWSGGDVGGWSIAGGSGDWARASGGGNLVAEYTPTGSVDHYTGSLNR